MESHKEKLAVKKKALDGLKAELRELLALDEYESAIQQCIAKIYWRDVVDADNALAEAAAQCEAEEAEVAGVQLEVDEAQRELMERMDLEAISLQMEALQKDLDGIGGEVEQKSTAVTTLKKKLNGIESGRQTVIKGRAELIAGLDDVNKKIRDITAKAKADADGEKREILENLDNCDRNINSLRAREVELREEKQSIAPKLGMIEQKEREISEAVRAASFHKDRLTRDRTNLLSNGGKMGMYGPRMGEILKATAADRLLKNRTYGPIGMHIKISPEFRRYGFAIESSIGKKLMTSFVVNSTEERVAISRILQRFNAQEHHNIILQPPHARYRVNEIPDSQTVCDGLIIDDDVIFNTIVDSAMIDTAILIDSANELARYVTTQNGVEALKGHITRAIDINAVTYTFKRGNKGAVSEKGQYQQFLAEDVAEVIKGVDEQIATVDAQIRGLNSDLTSVRAEKDTVARRVNAIESDLRSLGEKLRTLLKKRQELETQRDDCISAGQIDITPFEEERDERTDAIKTLNVDLDRLTADAETVKTDLKFAEGEKKKIDKRKESINKELSETEAKLQKCLGRQDSAKKALEAAKKKLEKIEKHFKDAITAMEGMVAIQAEKKSAAEENTRNLLGDNWDGKPLVLSAKETKDKLRGMIASKQKLLEEGKRAKGLEGKSKEVLQKRLSESAEAYKTDKAHADQLTDHIVGLEEDYKARASTWAELLKQNSKTVKRTFDKYLQKKGFAGDLKIDHDDKKLHINCQTDNRDERTQCNDVRQLSGGERSFTTLCLLMALGHVMESPFRLMDEYDVFLDEMTRKVTLTNLQAYALSPEQNNRQFIIITPQNLSDIKTSNEVRIRALGPPVRTSAHGLQQQTLAFGVTGDT